MICVDVGCGRGLAGMAGLGFTCRMLTASGTTTPDAVMKEVKHYGMLALGSCPRAFLAAALDVRTGRWLLPA